MVCVYYKFTERGKTHKELHCETVVMLGSLMKRIEGEGFCQNTKTSPAGKPFLTNSEVKFNFSHADGCILCALAGDKIETMPETVDEYLLLAEIDTDALDVGCDVEPYLNGMTTESKEKIARRFFTSSENKILDLSDDKGRSFTRIWTDKESLVKCTGEGLSSLKKADSTDPGDRFRILRYDLRNGGKEYSVSVCLEIKTAAQVV